MKPRALDLKTPRISVYWCRSLVVSIAFHALMLIAVLLTVLRPHLPQISNGSIAGGTTLSLRWPVVVSTSSPPALLPPVRVSSAPVAVQTAPEKSGSVGAKNVAAHSAPPRTTPAFTEGLPVLAAHATPLPPPVASTPSKLAPASPLAATHAPSAHHFSRPRKVAASTAPSVAAVASSYAPGEDVFAHPPYPEEAKERGEAGTVKVYVRFDPTGHVAEVKIAESSGSLILDHGTTTFIRANWHSLAEAGQVVSVPVRYSLLN